MLARLARLVGDRLALSLELPEEAAERAAYALEVIMLTILTLAAILSAAAAVGVFRPALAAAICAAALRAVSGGVHSESPWLCILYSTLLAVGFGYAGNVTAPYLQPAVLAISTGVVLLLGVALCLRYAPVDSPAKPIPAGQARVLKRLSLAVLALWAAGCLLPSALGPDLRGASLGGISWQLLSITPAGSRLLRSLDGLFGVRGGVPFEEGSP